MANFPNILDTPSTGGDFVHVMDFSGTNVASIDVTDIPQTYDSLRIIVNQFGSLTAGGDQRMRLSTDNGSTFISTASYDVAVKGITDSTADSTEQGVSATYIPVQRQAFSLAAAPPYNTIIIDILNYSDNQGDGLIRVYGNMTHTQATGFVFNHFWGVCNAGAAINAFQLYANAGNVTGNGKIYGINA